MWRLVFMTFFGKSRVSHEAEHHLHESPKVMLIPLGILAVLSIVGGWIGWPASLGGGNWLEHWLEPVFEHGPAVTAHVAAAEGGAGHDPTEYILMFASLAVALIGVGIAYHFFVRRPESADRMAEQFRPVHTLLLNKYYVDEVYSAVFVDGPVMGKMLGSGLSEFDKYVVDGGVNGAGWITRGTSSLSILWDTWVVDGAVRFLGFFTKVLSFPMRMIQTGFVSSYALVIVLGLLVISYFFAR
jgi:NADH-quinone oxidoreductase subunit L